MSLLKPCVLQRWLASSLTILLFLPGPSLADDTNVFLPAQTNQTIAELTTLTVTNTATASGIPVNTLSYQLLDPPTGAVIDVNGVITWTPAEDQGPSTNMITTVVTDNGVPALSATNSFEVAVNEVNSAPVLPAQTNQTIAELTPLTVTNTATDTDIPVDTLSYQLLDPPTGAVIDVNGVITWTPAEDQGPSTNTITIVVTDNGVPASSATNSFEVVVNEVNSAPVLPAQTNQTIAELTPLTVTNTATDTDIPVDTLSYQLLDPPTGAVIDINGVITWTPAEDQGPSTNTITIVVTDNGVPASSASNSFEIVVNEVNSAPVLPAQTNQTIAELTPLTVTNTATDSDIPVDTLSYQLLDPPTGAVIDVNGVITWTPAEDQGPSTNTITTVVTDNGVSPLSTTNSFEVVVHDVNSTSLLPVVSVLTLGNAAESGSPTGSFVVQRTGSTEQPLVVNYRLGGTASNGCDYQQLSAAVTIPAGQSSATIDIIPIDNQVEEPSKEVTVTLVPQNQPFTLVVLPDTQNYTHHMYGGTNDMFMEQTRWVAAHKDEMNIAFVLHEGDLTDWNSSADWANARLSMSVLNGVVPYALAVGNHDGNGSSQNLTGLFNQFFPLSQFQNLPTFGGVFESNRLDNCYHLFSAGGVDWLVLSLEFGPRDGVLAWANDIVTSHPDRRVIVLTHAHVYSDNTLQGSSPWHQANPTSYGRMNDGIDVWEKFLRHHANMSFVFNGHVLRHRPAGGHRRLRQSGLTDAG